MKKVNIIFLDVDGVLNSIDYAKKVYEETRKPHSEYEYPFDPECLERLQRLVAKTDARIVITSTWRKTEEGKRTLQNVLEQYDLANRVIGYTPILNTKRGEEIKSFLETLNVEASYIILDDDSDMEELTPYLILTSMKTGLTEEKMTEGMQKLKKFSKL